LMTRVGEHVQLLTLWPCIPITLKIITIVSITTENTTSVTATKSGGRTAFRAVADSRARTIAVNMTVLIMIPYILRNGFTPE
jgi:hypothetical protein